MTLYSNSECYDAMASLDNVLSWLDKWIYSEGFDKATTSDKTTEAILSGMVTLVKVTARTMGEWLE